MDKKEINTQRICDRLVDREVIACASMMIYELAHTTNDSTDWYEDLISLCVPRRQDAEIDALNDKCEGFREALDVMSDAISDALYDDDVLASAVASMRKNASAIQDKLETAEGQLAELENYGDCEVFEHWIVSNYLGEKLADRGEIVGELFGLTIWGRQTTGQSIAIDGVIREIAGDMEILPGQKYEWEV